MKSFRLVEIMSFKVIQGTLMVLLKNAVTLCFNELFFLSLVGTGSGCLLYTDTKVEFHV